MFSLKKRVTKLELLQKQSICGHWFREINVGFGSSLTIKAECGYCQKKISRSGTGKELFDAEKTLRNFLLVVEREHNK